MTALSERKIAIVRTLVESAPDRVVGSLRQALLDTSDNSALGGVRRLVENEVYERTLRNLVLEPIVPICIGAGDQARRLNFPARVLGLLWRGLRATDEDLIELVREEEHDEERALQLRYAHHDRLLAIAVEGLRAREAEPYRIAAEACDAVQPGRAELLILCLEIGAVVRRSVRRLHEWCAHSGGETAAAARLAYRDAVSKSDDAGPIFFQLLAAQMPEPWMILRIISAVMDKPTERYLAGSELAVFPEELMDAIDGSLDLIAAFKAEDGEGAAREAAMLADRVIHQVMELETCIELQRDQGWGQRVTRQRVRLAELVEGRVRAAEKAAAEALPVQGKSKGRRPIPRLTAAPDYNLVSKATTLLAFAAALRTTANYGGFSSALSKLVEHLGEYIDVYVDETVDLLRNHEVEDVDIAASYLRHAAGFDQLIRGEKAADLIRRRAHTALNPD